MPRQLRSSTQNKRPRTEIETPEDEDPSDTVAHVQAMARAVATVRANLAAIRGLNMEQRTTMLAKFPEDARRAVFAKFPEFAGATTAATQAPPLLALPLPPTGPDPAATSRALANATEATLRARIRALKEAAAAPDVPPDMDVLLARIAALENPPYPATRAPAADEDGPAQALGMQQLMALIRPPSAAPPPTPEVEVVSRAATESAALAAAQAALSDDGEDDEDDGEATKRHHFKELIDLEAVKSETRNREAAVTYYSWLAVKVKAQEIAKTRASYRRLVVVALGQIRRMRALAAAMPPGPLRSEQEAILVTAEQEAKFLQGQDTILKSMADACVFADDTWDPAAFFAMVGRRWTLVRKDPTKLNTILRELQDSPAYANLLKEPAGWVAPSAVDPLSPLAGLPGNASAATSAEGLGKGGKGGKGASTKNLKKTAARRGKGLKGTGASDSEDA